MEHLATRGLACPQPVRNRDGTALGTLCDRPAAIVSFLDGVSVEGADRASLRASSARRWPRLHAAGADFGMRRDNSLSVGAWRPLFDQAEPRPTRSRPGLAARTRDDLACSRRAGPRTCPAA